MNLFKVAPFMALVGLAACGDSDNDTSGAGGGGAPLLTFSELTEANATLIGEVAAAGPTPVEEIPDSGSAVYQGAITLSLQDGSGDGVIGQAQVSADFGTNTLSGGANNFFDLDGAATDGSLTLVNGTLTPGIRLAEGQMNGTVTFDSGSAVVTTNLDGAFLGDDAEFFTGTLSGNAAQANGDVATVQGGILAKQ